VYAQRVQEEVVYDHLELIQRQLRGKGQRFHIDVQQATALRASASMHADIEAAIAQGRDYIGRLCSFEELARTKWARKIERLEAAIEATNKQLQDKGIQLPEPHFIAKAREWRVGEDEVTAKQKQWFGVVELTLTPCPPEASKERNKVYVCLCICLCLCHSAPARPTLCSVPCVQSPPLLRLFGSLLIHLQQLLSELIDLHFDTTALITGGRRRLWALKVKHTAPTNTL
jgi:hypothetical protein